MRLLSDEEITLLAMNRAIEIMRERGVRVGDIVGHASDNMSYRVVSIKNGRATVERESGPGSSVFIGKVFPADELFDPEILMEEIETAMLSDAELCVDCGEPLDESCPEIDDSIH